MKRHFRKHPLHPAEHVSPEADVVVRNSIRLGWLWIVLAVLVMIIVIAYDRTAIHHAHEHMQLGEEYVKRGLYNDALPEFEQALDNKRLPRRERGRVALSIADIYFQQLENYPMAYKYYVQARLIAPAVVDNPLTQKRIQFSKKSSEGPGLVMNDSGSTRTVVQQVELISRPLEDFRGPVVASYNGGEIHAGALYRFLKKDPRFQDSSFRDDPDNVSSALNSLVQGTIAYEAAINAGVQRDPDVSTRLFDYQESLLAQRYIATLKQAADIISDSDVQKYYDSHRDVYHKPGQITLSMIKADSMTSATWVLQLLRGTTSFADAATSYSTDKASAIRHGVVGTLKSTDTEIPGVGLNPELVKGLFQMPQFAVSDVNPLNGAFYIFKIDGVVPARDTSVDEARGQIERILRGSAADQVKNGTTKKLAKRFQPVIAAKAVDQFWAFVDRQAGMKDKTTTGTALTSSTLTQSAMTTRSTAKALAVK